MLSNFFRLAGRRKCGWEGREEKRGENFCSPARSWLERFVKAARGNAFLDLPSVELINEVSCVPSGDGTWFIAAT